ncbi:MAG: hypothetical protein P4L73_13445 [Caulobacteraceae bacterium]|nr:hypothetical protein [Caulobacteraceae bacterium]
MKVSVLKPFDYAHDGVTVRHLEQGEDAVEIRDELAPGLREAGFIAPAKAKASAKGAKPGADDKPADGAGGEDPAAGVIPTEQPPAPVEGDPAAQA